MSKFSGIIIFMISFRIFIYLQLIFIPDFVLVFYSLYKKSYITFFITDINLYALTYFTFIVYFAYLIFIPFFVFNLCFIWRPFSIDKIIVNFHTFLCFNYIHLISFFFNLYDFSQRYLVIYNLNGPSGHESIDFISYVNQFMGSYWDFFKLASILCFIFFYFQHKGYLIIKFYIYPNNQRQSLVWYLRAFWSSICLYFFGGENFWIDFIVFSFSIIIIEFIVVFTRFCFIINLIKVIVNWRLKWFSFFFLLMDNQFAHNKIKTQI